MPHFVLRPPLSRDTEALISEIERKVELNQTTPRWGARYILTSFLSNNAFTRNANQQGGGGGGGSTSL